MSAYDFETVWTLDAPIEMVWDAIMTSEEWPEWWPYLASVAEIAPGDAAGIGAVRRYTWRGQLLYTLTFETTVVRVERPVLLEGCASGDLEGSGRCTLVPLGAAATRVRYEWHVRTTRRWMNLLDPLVHGLFVWNHDRVMRAGGVGLANHLAARLVAG